MSALIALSSKLPGDDEVNGLDSLHDDLVANPGQVVCAIVWLDVPKITTNTDTKEVRPTVRVRRIEPIGAVDKVPDAVVELAIRLQEQRTGRAALPFGKLEPNTDHVEIIAGDKGGDTSNVKPIRS